MHYLIEQADRYLEAAERESLRGNEEGARIATRMMLRRWDQYHREMVAVPKIGEK